MISTDQNFVTAPGARKPPSRYDHHEQSCSVVGRAKQLLRGCFSHKIFPKGFFYFTNGDVLQCYNKKASLSVNRIREANCAECFVIVGLVYATLIDLLTFI